MEKATVLLSASSYPTISDVRFYFLGIQEHLSDYIIKQGFSQNELALKILQKIEQYWNVVDSSTLVATVLDPRIKLTLFAEGEESTNAINAVRNLLPEYNMSPLPITSPVINEEKTSTREYFHQLKRRQLAIPNLSS